MSKKLKFTEQQLSALVTEASYKAVLTAKAYNQSSDVKAPVSIAEREAAGRAVEANRMKFEQAEMQKVLSCLKELSDEVKRLKKENQKISKAVQSMEKSEKKQLREMEYTEEHLADLKQDVRELNGKVKKLKDCTKETKKILQIFGAITGVARPSDNLKVIRKKFTDKLLLYNAKLKIDKKPFCNEKTIDFFG